MSSCTTMRRPMCNSNMNLDHNFFMGYFSTLSASYGNESEDEWIGKDLDRSYRGLIEVLSRYFPEGPKENHGRPHTAYSQCPPLPPSKSFPILHGTVALPLDNMKPVLMTAHKRQSDIHPTIEASHVIWIWQLFRSALRELRGLRTHVSASRRSHFPTASLQETPCSGLCNRCTEGTPKVGLLKLMIQ
jgi:hypothetical protein